MPAYEEEVEAALEEGVKIETLISPVKIHARQEEIDAALREGVELETLVSPIKIYSREGHLVGIECIRNRLGEEVDATGRRKPVPVKGSEFRVKLDTLIVAVGEKPKSEFLAAMGLEIDKGGRAKVNTRTSKQTLKGFLQEDLVTGPNTVIDAIAAGKKLRKALTDFYVIGNSQKRPSPSFPVFTLNPR